MDGAALVDIISGDGRILKDFDYRRFPRLLVVFNTASRLARAHSYRDELTCH